MFGPGGRGSFARFVAGWGVIYLFNVAFIALLIRLGLNAYAAGAVALVPVAAASYLLQKLFVFRCDDSI